ncbi:hypothetical protein EBZ02_07755 [bacterium]|nr:hypothetical protein [bacterium]
MASAGGAISRLILENKYASNANNVYFGAMTHTRSLQESGSNSVSAATLTYIPTTDGIPDNWWMGYGIPEGNRFALADPDGDGFTNAQEYALGTDPKNAGSTFKVGEMTRSGTNLTISWPSVAGKKYQVQTATQLGANSWQNAGEVVTPSVSGTSTVTVPVAADAPSCFVRVNLLP